MEDQGSGDLIWELEAETETEFTELEAPVTVFETQNAMRFGPRSYTPEQAKVIHLAVRQRKPLRAPPLPFDE